MPKKPVSGRIGGAAPIDLKLVVFVVLGVLAWSTMLMADFSEPGSRNCVGSVPLARD